MHDTMKRLREGSLSGRELAAALDHLAGCDECANAIDGSRDVAAYRAMFSAEVPEHLDFEHELVPFVEGTLDVATREIVLTHLESCKSCSAEVADVRALRVEMRRHPSKSRPYVLALAAAITIVIAGTAVLTRRAERRVDVVAEPRASVSTRTAPTQAVDAAIPEYANADWQRLVERTLAARALPYPEDVAAPKPRPDVLRGDRREDASGFVPAGVIAETRPQFSWPVRTGATYVVAVFADDEEIVRSEALQSPTWRPSRELARGVTYQWQVEVQQGEARVITPQPPAPQPEFRIAADAEVRAIEQARAAHPRDELLHAVLYARAGLRTQAEAALRRAIASGDPRARVLIRR